jgi:hypothetical protein
LSTSGKVRIALRSFKCGAGEGQLDRSCEKLLHRVKEERNTLQTIKLLLLLLNTIGWQQYSAHLHTNSTQNTQNGTYITIKIKNWELRAVPRLCELYAGIYLTTKEKVRKTSVRAVEKCPDIPVAVVQYTFTHKQYTEQNETEYTERNIHNNKVMEGSLNWSLLA